MNFNIKIIQQSLPKKCCTLFILCLLATISKAQFSDNFADTNFTSNPVWTGDAAQFTINGTQQLQLNSAGTDTSFLVTSSTIVNDAEWDFWMRLAFAPSNNNFVKIYIMSDQADLSGPLNGYFLRYGEDLANDNLELWKQNGTTVVKIIDGLVNAGAAGTNQQIRVKIKRSVAGLFELSGDYSGGTAYQAMGSISDLSTSSANYFGIWCKYTSTNATKFYFDDFYAGPVIIDNEPLKIASLSINSNDSLTVFFSEPAQVIQAGSAVNYLLSPGGTPSAINVNAANPTFAGLKFSSPFVSGQTYSLNIHNIPDFVGNFMADTNVVFVYYEPSAHDLVINELMVDPSPILGQPNTEYVEIFNRMSFPIDMSGWKIKTGSTVKVLSDCMIPADSFLIITDDGFLDQFIGNVTGLPTFSGLTNSGQTVLLLSPNDLEISRVTYADTWYNDAVKADGGYSLEQLNPNDFCGGKFNWSASVDETGGTPGRKNSIYLNLALPFQVYSVNASDSLNLTVTFNKSIDTLSLQTSQFTVNNGVGTPQSFSILSQESIKLTFSSPLQKNILYTLSVNSGIKNCAGVDLPLPSNNEFVLFTPQIFDVLITEILADPSPQIGLPDLEFVELHNRTALPVDLQGWTFSTGSTSKTIPEGIILPGSYIVLTAPEGVNLFQGVSLAPINSFPSLTNSGSTLSIKDKNNNIIHSVTYSDSWYQETGKKDGGWSLEMIDPNNPCAGKENWHDSKDSHGGTPGLINSVNAANADTALPRPSHVGLMSDTLLVYFSEKINKNVWSNTKVNIDNGMGIPLSTSLWEPDWDKVLIKLPMMPQAGIVYTISFSDSILDCAGNHVRNNATLKFKIPEVPILGDAIINEVMNNTLGDGVEFTEIYNLSTKALDLKELRLCEADSSLGTLTSVKEITPYSLLLMPGEYMLFSNSQSIVKSQYKTENADAFWDLVSMIDITNAGGTVALAKKTYDIIDIFSFDESFHFPLINVLDGVSLERIDPTRPTQDKSNWNSAAANVGYATPGYRNSQFLQAGSSNNEFSLEPEVFSPDNDGYQDVLNISYKLDSPGNVVSVTIYDEIGRQIRSLLSSELLGTEGTFSWNGIADNNSKARIGVYVVYIELFDQKGKKKHYKLPVVVASKL